jgi:hypothetical protein
MTARDQPESKPETITPDVSIGSGRHRRKPILSASRTITGLPHGGQETTKRAANVTTRRL